MESTDMRQFMVPLLRMLTETGKRFVSRVKTVLKGNTNEVWPSLIIETRGATRRYSPTGLTESGRDALALLTARKKGSCPQTEKMSG